MENIIDYLFSVLETDTTFNQIIGLSITIVALLLTLAIIPFQKLSEVVSSNVYKILLRNKIYNRNIKNNFIFAIIQVLAISFAPRIMIVQIISSVLLLLILINTYIFFIKTRNNLDVYESVMSTLEADFCESLNELLKFNDELVENPFILKKILEDRILDSFLGAGEKEENKKNISKDVFFPLTYKLSNIYDFIYKTVTEKQYGSYEKCTLSLFNCIRFYLNKTSYYSISQDLFFIDFIETSKEIIRKTKQNEYNRMFKDLYIRYLLSLRKNLQPNQNNNYLIMIFNAFFESLDYSKNDFFDDIQKIEPVLDVFSECDVSEFLFSEMYNRVKEVFVICEKINITLFNSAINRIANVFCFYMISNKNAFLHGDLLVDRLLELLRLVKTENTIIPLTYNDFSTNFSTDFREDKSISKMITILLFAHCDEEERFRIPFNIKLIDGLIDIITERAKSRTSYKSGCIEQLYKIFFELYLAIDAKAFMLFYHTNWHINYSIYEKEFFLKKMQEILLFFISSYSDFFTSDKELLIFSCLKIQLRAGRLLDKKMSSYRKMFLRPIMLNIMFNRHFPVTEKEQIFEILIRRTSGKYKDFFTRILFNEIEKDRRSMFVTYRKKSYHEFKYVMMDGYNKQMTRVMRYVNKKIVGDLN